MDGASLLRLFADLTGELMDELESLQDWGLSGARPGQYHHDVVADRVLVAPLIDAGLSVLSEESGLVDRPGSAITVVVDPVDGSTNASNGLPWYATSLCAVDSVGLLAASVTNLATGERYEAIRGEGFSAEGSTRTGAGRAGSPSSVRTLADSLVAFSGLPPSHGGWNQYRAYGAAALDMCAVAAGVFDGFVDVDGAHGVWDYLGATLICQEAGAVVADAEGRELVVLDPLARRAPVAAATAELLAELLEMRRGWSGG